jgi:Flp pilus assembly protein TadG
MRSKPAADRRARPGAAALELALLLPFLAILASATVDLARVLYATQVLENAAYAGALTASGTTWVPGYPGTAVEAAKTAACAESPGFAPTLQASNVTVSIASGVATVTVACDFPLATAVMYPTTTVRLSRTATIAVAPRPGD